MTRLFALALLCCVLIAPGTARADQNDASLNELFERLQTTTDPREGRVIEQAIWDHWTRHDDADIGERMSVGIEAMNAGSLGFSLRVFDEIVDLAPAFAEGWNKRATVYYLLGNLEASVHDIQKTLALEPRHFGALSGMGLIYSTIGNDEAALKVWEKALTINPRMPGIRARVKELRQELKGEST